MEKCAECFCLLISCAGAELMFWNGFAGAAWVVESDTL